MNLQPQKIENVWISDGQGGQSLVMPGDLVELLTKNDFYLKHLGKGPYQIKWIGLWPYGIMLYLKTNTKEIQEIGVRANDFISKK